jgi:uncharacterized protein
MLLQYSVKNFLSFKDQVSLSMVASKRRSKAKALDLGAIWHIEHGLDALKCAVIYGANNSGKSNLVKSLLFLKRLVLDSSRESRAADNIQVTPFLLDPETEHAPSEFEVIFVKDKFIFQYEVAVTRERVEFERLSRKSLKKNANTVELFSRVRDVIEVGRSFKEGKGLEGRTRSNALFLSVCANFDGEVSSLVQKWFQKIGLISGLNNAGSLAWTAGNLDSPEIGEKIQSFLKAFDLGVDRFEGGDEIPGIEVTGVEVSGESASNADSSSQAHAQFVESFLKQFQRKPSRKVVSIHRMQDSEGGFVREVPFDLNVHESEGTKRLVALAGPIVASLMAGSILVVDEFESRLHSNITKVILDVFNSIDGNPRGAQLVAVTHDTNLLSGDHLRRDQIWFAGRSDFGATSLKSLVEYRVRNDASFEKNYLEGEYGGVPYLRSELTRFDLENVRGQLKQSEK